MTVFLHPNPDPLLLTFDGNALENCKKQDVNEMLEVLAGAGVFVSPDDIRDAWSCVSRYNIGCEWAVPLKDSSEVVRLLLRWLK